jgi:1-phosphatidylinositol-4-phosphate 5-kinase
MAAPEREAKVPGPAAAPQPAELVVDAPLASCSAAAAAAAASPRHPATTATTPAASIGRYTGTVRNGLPSGLGTATCPDGASYDGEWSGGRPHGFGTLVWPSLSSSSSSGGGGGGDGAGARGGRYDGELRHGLRDGVGVRTYADGGVYDGSWRGGRKHGLGVYRPPTAQTTPPQPHEGATPPPPRRSAPAGESLCRLSVASSFGGGGGGAATPPPPFAWPLRSAGGGGEGEATPDEGPTPRATVVDGAVPPPPPPPPRRFSLSLDPAPADSSGGGGGSTSGIWLREYEHGALRRQESLSRGEVKAIASLLWPQQQQTPTQPPPDQPSAETPPEPPLPPRRAPLGQAVIKGHPSHALVQARQLGLRQSVAAAAAAAEQQQPDPAASTANATTTLRFPRAGSFSTPPHSAGVDFVFKDYSPQAFRRLRATWKIPDAAYVLSLGGAASLRQLTSPGKSGSAFFVTADGAFLVKTCKRAEARVLRRMLPAYERHCAQHAPSTLLPRFFGLHRVTPLAAARRAGGGKARGEHSGGATPGRQVRFVVMSNVFSGARELIHRRYDLKGSTEGRTAQREVGARLARLVVGGGGPDAAAAAMERPPPIDQQQQQQAALDADPTLVLKDLDLDFSLRLAEGGASASPSPSTPGPPPPLLPALRRQLALDASFLRDAGVMDYSLLLGVHFLGERAEAARRVDARRAAEAAAAEAAALGGGAGGAVAATRGPGQVSSSGGGGGGKERPDTPRSFPLPTPTADDGGAAAAAAAPPPPQPQPPPPPPRNFELRSGAAELEELLARAASRCAQMGLPEGRAKDVAALVRLKFLGSRLRQRRLAAAATMATADATTPALSPAGSLFPGAELPAATPLLTSHAPPLPPPPVRPPPPLALAAQRPPEIVPAPPLEEEDQVATATGTTTATTTPRAPGPPHHHHRLQAGAALAYLRSMRGAFFGAVVADGPSQQGGSEEAAAAAAPAAADGAAAAAALGESMRAWAVPALATDHRREQEVLLSFGIIDVLQDYSPRKRLERRAKALALALAAAGRDNGGAAVAGALRLSVAPPAVYAARFLEFVGGRVFRGGAGGGGAAPETAQASPQVRNGGKGAEGKATMTVTTLSPTKEPLTSGAKLNFLPHGGLLLSPRSWSLAARR